MRGNDWRSWPDSEPILVKGGLFGELKPHRTNGVIVHCTIPSTGRHVFIHITNVEKPFKSPDITNVEKPFKSPDITRAARPSPRIRKPSLSATAALAMLDL